MSFNLVESAKSLFTKELVSKIAAYFEENEPGVTKAINCVIPSVVTGLANKASEPDGIGKIIQYAQEYHQSGIAKNPENFLNTNANDLLQKGSNLFSRLFGGTAPSLSTLVADYANVKPSTASSLFGMGLPVILSLLGKHAASNNGGVSNVSTVLSNQNHYISGAVPDGFSLSRIFNNASDKISNIVKPNATTNTYVPADDNKSKGGAGILLPLLLLCLLAFAVWYFLKDGCNSNTKSVAATADSITNNAVNNVTATLGKLDSLTGDFFYDQGDTVTVDLPNNAGHLTVGKYSTEYRLINFLSSKDSLLDSVKGNWFEFTNVHFKTGTSTLTDSSVNQLKNFALIAKAFPAAQFKIGGYTDSTGDANANVALSQKRADAVAELVKKLGVTEKSLEGVKGYGKEWPIATNETPEGRAMNRRVAVNVKAK